MNRHIVVPVNFSNISEIGLATAIPIAKKIKAKITLLHVVEEQYERYLSTSADLMARAIESQDHKHYMVELIKKRDQQLQGIVQSFNAGETPVETAMRFGTFKGGLKSFLRENEVDLVVMGTSGETNISEFFTGNHAAQAVRNSSVPVLAAKDFYLTTGLDKLLLLVNSDDYDEKAVRLLKRLLDLLHLQVTIGYVKEQENGDAQFIREMLFSFEEDTDINVSKITLIPFGNKIDQIEEYVEENNVNLVATISKGHSGLVRLFEKNTTEKLINSLSRPVLTIAE